MVWVVQWSQPGQGESHTSVWATQADGLKAACGEMLIAINDYWDLDDEDALENAHEINNLVAVGDYQKALNEYSDYASERDDEYAQFWDVSERVTNTHPNPPTLLLLSPLEDDEEEFEEEEDDGEIIDEVYQASVPGATCRGPCKSVNEHAYADRRDGTHVCYQCKMMSEVFGGTIK